LSKLKFGRNKTNKWQHVKTNDNSERLNIKHRTYLYGYDASILYSTGSARVPLFEQVIRIFMFRVTPVMVPNAQIDNI